MLMRTEMQAVSRFGAARKPILILVCATAAVAGAVVGLIASLALRYTFAAPRLAATATPSLATGGWSRDAPSGDATIFIEPISPEQAARFEAALGELQASDGARGRPPGAIASRVRLYKSDELSSEGCALYVIAVDRGAVDAVNGRLTAVAATSSAGARSRDVHRCAPRSVLHPRALPGRLPAGELSSTGPSAVARHDAP
jgi:hypothetical protein